LGENRPEQVFSNRGGGDCSHAGFSQSLGAELDVVASVQGRPRVTPQDISNMVERVAELAAQPGHYATDQFNNPYPIAHYRDHLAREIWEQTEGRMTVHRLAERLGPDAVIVTLAVDRGFKYMSVPPYGD
jgi:cysteine synthase